MGCICGRQSLLDEENRTIHLNGDNIEYIRHNKHYKNNRVQTAKYTWWNFIPLNILFQFRKVPNMYFLVITFLQTIEYISITNGRPANIPSLSFVVFLSMVKDAYEDFKRHQNDKSENRSKCKVFDH